MQVLNRYKLKEGETGTYIGRGTQWGNPYVVDKEEGMERGDAAKLFRKRMARLLAARETKAVKAVMDLAKVENVICSCAPLVCHGDVYKEIWDIIHGKKISPMEGIREWVKDNGYPEGPHTDGINHINIYSKGKTRLGKFLTNMSDIPVKTQHGTFESMEGYWYWLSTGMCHDFFRDVGCFEAKKRGRTMERVDNSRFMQFVKQAMKAKLEQYPRMLEEFKKTDSPFKHYYFFGDNDDRTVVFPGFDWITTEWERLREYYQGTIKSCIVAGSRGITDYEIVKKAIKDSSFGFNEVVCGEAAGVDTLGRLYAKKNKLYINSFIPDWDTLGKKAGMLRNIEMGDYADMGIVIVQNNSKGSTQMKEYLEKLGKPVFVVEIND